MIGPKPAPNVTLRKIRQRGRGSHWQTGLTFTGVLVVAPRVGQQLAIVHRSTNHRVTTSTVLRMLRGDEHSIYVETEHSVYRITFG